MRGTILILGALLAAPGCATTWVGGVATRQMATEPDIYTDQVLGNLARLADNPSALAYFGLLQSAVDSTNDTGTITIGGMTFSTQSVVKSFHNPRSGTIGPI